MYLHETFSTGHCCSTQTRLTRLCRYAIEVFPTCNSKDHTQLAQGGNVFKANLGKIV